MRVWFETQPVADLVSGPIVEIFHHFVLGKVAADDGAAFKACLGQFLDQIGAFQAGFGSDHEREAEPARITDFLLDHEFRMAGKALLHEGAIGAAALDQGGQFLKLGNAERAGHLERAQVVAGQDEAEAFLEGIVGFLACHVVELGQVACPAMGAQDEHARRSM